MTTTDQPRPDHDARCISWHSNDPALCDCHDDQGKAPRTTWADGPLGPFDLETTAADPTVARIVTATVIRVRPGVDPHTTNWLSDVDGEDIPAEAAKIHGVTTEQARAEGRPLADVVDEIRTAIELEWQAGIPVVGHNVSYDLTVLAAECRRFRMRPFEVAGPVIDSIVLDRGADRYRRGKRTLTAACEVYGVVLTDAHASDADALAAARVAWKIAKKYPRIGRMSLDELQTWQREAHRAWADNFGAYLARQGKTDDVDRDWPMRGSA